MNKIAFVLVVNALEVKYTDEKSARHLFDILQAYYNIKVNWEGTNYSGLILQWDYKERVVDISLSGYIDYVLTKFNNRKLLKNVDAYSAYTPQQYGVLVQYKDTGELPTISPLKIKFI